MSKYLLGNRVSCYCQWVLPVPNSAVRAHAHAARHTAHRRLASSFLPVPAFARCSTVYAYSPRSSELPTGSPSVYPCHPCHLPTPNLSTKDSIYPGPMLIVVQQRRSRQSFRIHRSVLACRSDILNDRRLGSEQGHRESTINQGPPL